MLLCCWTNYTIDINNGNQRWRHIQCPSTYGTGRPDVGNLVKHLICLCAMKHKVHVHLHKTSIILWPWTFVGLLLCNNIHHNNICSVVLDTVVLVHSEYLLGKLNTKVIMEENVKVKLFVFIV